MKTTYKIKEAHSGTSKKEIAKAKKLFKQAVNNGNINAELTNEIMIEFSDVNYQINATFLNEAYQEIFSCKIN